MKYLKIYENFQSDDEIHNICKKYNITNYNINNDVVNVDGDVNLSYRKLSKLPLKFGTVKGDFSCSHCGLTTLIGSPSEVGGDFDCMQNGIKNLEGGPIRVNKSVCLDNNQLTTLEGCPEYIGGSLHCRKNSIYDFIGIEYIGGDLICYDNLIEDVWYKFGDVSKIELLNYIDPFRPPEVEGGKPICYLDKFNQFLKEIGEKKVEYLKNYECR